MGAGEGPAWDGKGNLYFTNDNRITRRDASGIYSDWAHVMIDSYRDRRTAFRFSVNPRGVQKDVLEFDDRAGEDLNWDAVWQVATRVDSAGWVAEYRIPFSQLRFGSARARFIPAFHS